jgi:hypothetical protein
MPPRETGAGPAEAAPRHRDRCDVIAVAAGVAVSLAVTTVPRGRDPAPAVTGTAPAVTAVAGHPSLSRWAGGSGL